MGFCLFNNVALAAAHALKQLRTQSRPRGRFRRASWEWDAEIRFTTAGRGLFFFGPSRAVLPRELARPLTRQAPGRGTGNKVQSPGAVRDILARTYLEQFQTTLEQAAARSCPELLLDQRRIRRPPGRPGRFSGTRNGRLRAHHAAAGRRSPTNICQGRDRQPSGREATTSTPWRNR